MKPSQTIAFWSFFWSAFLLFVFPFASRGGDSTITNDWYWFSIFGGVIYSFVVVYNLFTKPLLRKHRVLMYFSLGLVVFVVGILISELAGPRTVREDLRPSPFWTSGNHGRRLPQVAPPDPAVSHDSTTSQRR